MTMLGRGPVGHLRRGTADSFSKQTVTIIGAGRGKAAPVIEALGYIKASCELSFHPLQTVLDRHAVEVVAD